jgi:hypothetical protein
MWLYQWPGNNAVLFEGDDGTGGSLAADGLTLEVEDSELGSGWSGGTAHHRCVPMVVLRRALEMYAEGEESPTVKP